MDWILWVCVIVLFSVCVIIHFTDEYRFKIERYAFQKDNNKCTADDVSQCSYTCKECQFNKGN